MKTHVEKCVKCPSTVRESLCTPAKQPRSSTASHNSTERQPFSIVTQMPSAKSMSSSISTSRNDVDLYSQGQAHDEQIQRSGLQSQRKMDSYLDFMEPSENVSCE